MINQPFSVDKNIEEKMIEKKNKDESVQYGTKTDETVEQVAKTIADVAPAKNPVETQPDEVLDVRNWTIISPLERLKIIQEKFSAQGGEKKAPNIWVLDDSLSPLTLYLYLKARFGEPNGFTMASKHPSSANLIHWHYSFICNDRTIDIFGKNTQTEFYVDWTRKLEDGDWQQLIQSVLSDLKNYGPQLGEVRNSLDKYILFVNPHQRITSLVKNFHERLLGLAIEEKPLPPNPRNIVELERINNLFEEYAKAYTEAAALSTSLKILIPIWVESFINLLIFILRKDELKKDVRVYESVFRLQIDVRVKSLSVYCNEFIKPIDAENDAFKNFHSLMNERNNLLHGNVDPNKYPLGEVYFDGNSFIAKEQESFSERALKNQLMYVEPHSAIKDVETAKTFIEFVLSHLQPALIDPIRMIMDCSEPGWHEKNKHVAVLFPDHIAESFIGLPEMEIEEESNKDE